VFRALLVALGVSSTKGYDMNSLAVPRKAKEAIGAIARLVNPTTGQAMTVNVEYNQLDPLMRATGWPQGDTNDPDTGGGQGGREGGEGGGEGLDEGKKQWINWQWPGPLTAAMAGRMCADAVAQPIIHPVVAVCS
jgi:hypothetical protein